MDREKKSLYNRRYREKQKQKLAEQELSQKEKSEIVKQPIEKKEIKKEIKREREKIDNTSPSYMSYIARYSQYILPVALPIIRAGFFFWNQKSSQNKDGNTSANALDPLAVPTRGSNTVPLLRL